MQFRKLGNSELMISPLAFGGNVLGWTLDEKKSFTLLDAFTEAGFNFIDTADIYARWATGMGGESETILGNWMKKRNNRKQLILATKVGMDMGGNQSGLSKKYILQAIDRSLLRLQTDYIDLYQSHKDDLQTPLEETLEAFEHLIKLGKVRYIGASNFSASRLEESLNASQKNNLPAYISLQPHYNLCERKHFETELEQVCTKHNLGVINYFPLASGFLTGKYRSEVDFSKSVRGGSMQKYLNEKHLNIIRVLEDIATKHHTKIVCVTLAWYLKSKTITAPIVSATSIEQLNDLFNSCTLLLDQADLERIDVCSK